MKFDMKETLSFVRGAIWAALVGAALGSTFNPTPVHAQINNPSPAANAVAGTGLNAVGSTLNVTYGETASTSRQGNDGTFPYAITSTVATGTAPFIVASTTQVSNLNVSLLAGCTWAIPCAIGTTTPAAGNFSSIGATTPGSGAFTTLSASTPNPSLNYQGSATGSGSLSYQSKMGEWISIADFYANGSSGALVDPTGTTDSTAGIQDAINVGKNVYVPCGKYLISSALSFSIQGQKIEGLGFVCAQFYQNTSTVPIIDVTNNDVTISDLTLNYNGTGSSGSYEIYTNSTNTIIQNVGINGGYNNIHLASPASNAIIDHLVGTAYVNAGVFFDGGSGSSSGRILSNFTLNAVNSTNGANGGLYLLNQVQGVQVLNGDVLNGSYSMVQNASTYSAGTRPAYNKFTNVYLDGSVNGSYLNNLVDTVFTAVWWSGGRSGGGNPGMHLLQSDSIEFDGNEWINSGSYGGLFDSTAARVSVIGGRAISNAVTTGSNTAGGLYFNGTVGFKVSGLTATNALGLGGTQAQGILVGNSSNSFIIENSYLLGNGTGPISWGTGITGAVIRNNVWGTPSISSGFGTSPSVSSYGNSDVFRVNVGTGGTASTGAINLPTAPNGWNCFMTDYTTPNKGYQTLETNTTGSTVSIAQYNSSGTATAWSASDVLQIHCDPY